MWAISPNPQGGYLWLSVTHHPGDTVFLYPNCGPGPSRRSASQLAAAPLRETTIKRLLALAVQVTTEQKQAMTVQQEQKALTNLAVQIKATQQTVRDLERQYQQRLRLKRPKSGNGYKGYKTRYMWRQKRCFEAESRWLSPQAKEQQAEQTYLAQRLAQ